jgi:hypothetical protein
MNPRPYAHLYDRQRQRQLVILWLKAISGIIIILGIVFLVCVIGG